MKREILFRGLDESSKEWVYGYFYEECGNTYIIENRQGKDMKLERNIPHIVIPETVGQFTGLLDKNGKKIFEGDILAFERERNFIIENIHHFIIEWEDYGNGMVGWSQFSPINMFVIAGNIHENKDLIK